MELTWSCAIVLVIATALVGATPHGYGGYGVKGGAAAGAQAGAVAGAYSGVGTVPVALPSGEGFSGSFSKSSSSSFAASSASSSSSSFSFSGSGAPANSIKCTSGVCPNAVSYVNGSPSNSNLNGYYNSANGAAGAQAGALAGSQAFLKNDDATPCEGNNCFNQKGSNCEGNKCNDLVALGNKCQSGHCEPTAAASPEPSPGDTSNSKCSFGQCGATVVSNVPSLNNYNNLNTGNAYKNKCINGNCGTAPTEDIPIESNNPLKCASGQCSTQAGEKLPSTHGTNDNKCPSGHCDTLSAKDTAPDYAPTKCTSGNCASSSSTEGTQSSYVPNENLNTPNKCTSGLCIPPIEKKTNNVPSQCPNGQCYSGESQVPTEKSDDIPVNLGGSSSSNHYGSNYQSNDKSAVSTVGFTPSCTSSNCASLPSSHPTQTQVLVSTYPKPDFPIANKDYSNCNSPNCNNGAYNPHAVASGSISAPTYNKPASILTTPKQESPCTTPNCQSSKPSVNGQYSSSSIVPGYESFPPYSPNTKLPCTSGSCDNSQFTTPDNSLSSSKLPSTEYKPQGSKCTTPNCGANIPKTPYQQPQSVGSANPTDLSGMPSYTPPNQPQVLLTPGNLQNPKVYTPNFKPPSPGIHYPTSQPTVLNSFSSPSLVPQPSKSSYSPNLTTAPSTSESNIPNIDGSIPPFHPLGSSKPNCVGYNCGVSPTNHPSYGHNSVPSHPSQLSSGSYSPQIPSNISPNLGENNKKTEKPYLGGFGGPTGLLKPNEFNAPSLIQGNKPLSATGVPITAPCASSNCPPGNLHQGVGTVIGIQVGTHNSAPCATGNCNSQKGHGQLNSNTASAVASATAAASAIAYTGGFGGPPGLLVPFDDGKLGSGLSGIAGKNAGSTKHVVNAGQSVYNHGGALAGAAAQATAVAGASAGGIGGSYNHGANGGHGHSGGCGGGCGGSGSAGTGRNLGYNSGSENSKIGYDGSLSVAGAAAKADTASYGSSFASAHASAGAAVKGGYYGRR